MRLRNVRGSKEEIDTNEYVIHNPEQHKGKWKEVFGNDNPLHIEIGMGKGKFICQLAVENPNINYLGIEKYSSVLIRGIEKRKDLELSNLFFLCLDAETVNNVFDKGEVERIYLNFSDPWPKDRHARRRLTSKEFLSRYKGFLKEEGEIIFKTDNRLLFDFSLEEAESAGWALVNHTYDLHNSEYVTGNVMTEYEEKFSGLGNPIHRMVIKQK